jgi:hypothetical protein
MRGMFLEASNTTWMLFYTNGDKDTIMEAAKENYAKINSFLAGWKYLLGQYQISYLDLMLFEDEEMLDAFSMGDLMVEFPYLRFHMETIRRLPQMIDYRFGRNRKFSKDLTFFGSRAELDVVFREF